MIAPNQLWTIIRRTNNLRQEGQHGKFGVQSFSLLHVRNHLRIGCGSYWESPRSYFYFVINNHSPIHVWQIFVIITMLLVKRMKPPGVRKHSNDDEYAAPITGVTTSSECSQIEPDISPPSTPQQYLIDARKMFQQQLLELAKQIDHGSSCCLQWCTT